jgi:uncharacterized membrane protein YeiH
VRLAPKPFAVRCELARTPESLLTGIGGGMARDVLLAQIPTVLRAELYAVAAPAGAAVVVGAAVLQLPAAPAALAGAGLCFGLRVLAIKHGWRLPVAAPPGDPPSARDETSP